MKGMFQIIFYQVDIFLSIKKNKNVHFNRLTVLKKKTLDCSQLASTNVKVNLN